MTKKKGEKSTTSIGASLTQYFRGKVESNNNMLTALIMMLFKLAF